MKVFLDANILVSVLNKEYPVFTYSSRVLSLTQTKRVSLYTTPLCLAIAFYFSSKKSGERLAKQKIALLAEKVSIITISEKAVVNAIGNKKINDLEDGFQYYSAIESGCSCIVTEDKNDFYFSEIDVLGAEAFLKTFVF